jgi:hypothetical protein
MLFHADLLSAASDKPTIALPGAFGQRRHGIRGKKEQPDKSA